MKYNTISLSSLCLLHFCYDSKNVNSPSVLIDFHQRKLEKKCLEKMHLFNIYNFVLSIDCFFSFDRAAPTFKVKDYSLVYNCTTTGAIKYDFVCLCVQSSTNGQCHNLYTVAQACSVPSSSSTAVPSPTSTTTTSAPKQKTTTTTATTKNKPSTTTTSPSSSSPLPTPPPPPSSTTTTEQPKTQV